jgi:hypothetical protein
MTSEHLTYLRELVANIRGTDTSGMGLRELHDELADCLKTEEIGELSRAFYTVTLDGLVERLARR